jgi:hypothetical protein
MPKNVTRVHIIKLTYTRELNLRLCCQWVSQRTSHHIAGKEQFLSILMYLARGMNARQ